MEEVQKVRQVTQSEAKEIDTSKISYFTLIDGTVVVVKRNEKEGLNQQVPMVESQKEEDAKFQLENKSKNVEQEIQIQSQNEQLISENNDTNNILPNQINQQNNLSNQEYPEQDQIQNQSPNQQFLSGSENEKISKISSYISSGFQNQSKIKNNREIMDEGENYGFFYTAVVKNNTMKTSNQKNTPIKNNKNISQTQKQPPKKRQLYKLVEAIPVKLSEYGTIPLFDQNTKEKLNILESNNCSYLFEPSKSTYNIHNKYQNNTQKLNLSSKNSNKMVKNNSYKILTQPHIIINNKNNYQRRFYRNNYNQNGHYYNTNHNHCEQRTEINQYNNKRNRNYSLNQKLEEPVYRNKINKTYNQSQCKCNCSYQNEIPNHYFIKRHSREYYKNQNRYEDFHDHDRYEEPHYYQNQEEYNEPQKFQYQEEYNEPQEFQYQKEYHEPHGYENQEEYYEPQEYENQKEYNEPHEYENHEEYNEQQEYQNQEKYDEQQKYHNQREYHYQKEYINENEKQYHNEKNKYCTCHEKNVPIYQGRHNQYIKCICPIGNHQIRNEYEIVNNDEYNQKRNSRISNKYENNRRRK